MNRAVKSSGRPTLLAAFPDDDVVPGSAIHRVGQLAPRLDPDRSLRDQVEAALAERAPQRFADVADPVTSVPGQAYPRLAELFYRLLRLSAPQVLAAPQPFTCDGLVAPAGTPQLVLSTDAIRPRMEA